MMSEKDDAVGFRSCAVLLSAHWRAHQGKEDFEKLKKVVIILFLSDSYMYNTLAMIRLLLQQKIGSTAAGISLSGFRHS